MGRMGVGRRPTKRTNGQSVAGNQNPPVDSTESLCLNCLARLASPSSLTPFTPSSYPAASPGPRHARSTITTLLGTLTASAVPMSPYME